MLRLFNRAREDQPWLPWHLQEQHGEDIWPLQDVDGIFNMPFMSYDSFRAKGEPMSASRRSPKSMLAEVNRLYFQVAGSQTKETTQTLRQQVFPF